MSASSFQEKEYIQNQHVSQKGGPKAFSTPCLFLSAGVLTLGSPQPFHYFPAWWSISVQQQMHHIRWCALILRLIPSIIPRLKVTLSMTLVLFHGPQEIINIMIAFPGKPRKSINFKCWIPNPAITANNDFVCVFLCVCSVQRMPCWIPFVLCQYTSLM